MYADVDNGRAFETASNLGPFLRISPIPDVFPFSHHIPMTTYFSDPSTQHEAFQTIKTAMNTMHDCLAELLLLLLRDADARENVFEFLAAGINANASRSKTVVDYMTCASSGIFMNLSAVMLRLCNKFLDAELTKREQIDASYAHHSNRLKLSGLPGLHASEEKIKEWLNCSDQKCSQQSTKASSSGSNKDGEVSNENSAHGERKRYTLICECFFMTARVLNLGLVKVISDFEQLGLETEEKLCYEAQLVKDNTLIQNALPFYRLMIVWLADLVGGLKMPLPQSCPMEFAAMPEHFVDDAMNILIFASGTLEALHGVKLDEFLNFIIMFMASPEFIKNPYLRTRMVEVLISWMRPHTSNLSATATLFKGNQDRLCQEYLVRNLLKLYIDIESMGSQDGDAKSLARYDIAILLENLWKVPTHCNAWKQIAEQEENGAYLNFLNCLISDSNDLLDEGLKKIFELEGFKKTRELEGRLPVPEEEGSLRSQKEHVRVTMLLAIENFNMLDYTSEEITAPFLVPEMVGRVAGMLNYFLMNLVGPGKLLSVEDLEEYEFHPKRLLRKMVQTYVHLARGDKNSVLPAAIAMTRQSNDDKLFDMVANAYRGLGEDGKVREAFIALGDQAKVAASDSMDEEIPDDFLDKIQYTLMKDPVKLPTSPERVDRLVIQIYLLNHKTCPFTRLPLTYDMVVPDEELKARIEKFMASRKKK
ncbi:hypothetical protein RIF29_31856 [Crotalaria pallida]|uniref:RING-type E3 ubiquitin transferase n=1 Tax=Crotalaria pallida TaxID=3830 RepID=A0AAN9HZ23_CROPI